MDIDKVERSLARSFHARPQQLGESATVIHRRTPLSLAKVLEPALAEDEIEEYAGTFEDWPGNVQQILGESDAMVSLMRFHWDGFGPISWIAGLDLVGAGRRRYLCAWDEQESYRAVASVEPWDDDLALSAAVSAYLSVNGTRHGDGLFGSLPGEVENHHADLLPTPVVWRALYEYMEWAERSFGGAWGCLAAEHYGRIVEPDHLQRCLDILDQFSSFDVEEFDRESAALSPEARLQLFNEWFDGAYEPSHVRD